MNTRSVQSSYKLSGLRRLAVACATFGVLCSAAPVSAQLARIGGSIGSLEPGSSMRGTDTAYDPARDVYLQVVGNGAVYGVFVNGSGNPVSFIFPIMDGSLGWGHFPRAEYSPDIAGGQGGFLVTWHHNAGAVNLVYGRLVSIAVPGVLASPIQQISDGSQGSSWWETGPAMAYSRTSRRFLVAWRTVGYAISGRLLDVNGTPVSGILPLAVPGPGVGHRDPSLAWNPATDDFGLASTGWNGAGALASFRRIRASDGYLWGQTDFGYSAGTFATAIDVNAWNNQYVLAWSVHPGTNTATFDPYGTHLGTSFVTSRLGYDQSLGLGFNWASGTFLAVSSDGQTLEIGAVEVTGSGQPNSTAQVVTDGARLGSFHPMTTARGALNQWNIVYARDFRGATSQFVATSSTGGGNPGGPAPAPAPQPSGCTTPDPFVALGGGTCVNGGWLPPGSAPAPAPAPAPSPQPTGCTTPDPFVSIGGGTCINGGWVPASSAPAPAPAPAPQPTGCTTPDPFISIGGGSCVNGGWVPKNSSCTTPDPFVSLGGGTCVNGGWLPPSSVVAPTPTPTTGCTTPDPFVSIGGGSCVNGGWVPKNSSCTTPDPFVSLGGGTCVNGGWLPPGEPEE